MLLDSTFQGELRTITSLPVRSPVLIQSAGDARALLCFVCLVVSLLCFVSTDVIADMGASHVQLLALLPPLSALPCWS